MSDGPPTPLALSGLAGFKQKKEEEEEKTVPGPPPPGNAPPIGMMGSGKKKPPKKKFVERSIDFKKYHETYDISQPIDWKGVKCSSVSESGSGANGVFFLQAKNDKIFILKGSSYVADEIFASLLAKYMGVIAPRIELIEYHPAGYSDCYGEDWWGSKMTLARLGKENYGVKTRYEANLDRAFYLKMEFVHGKNIFQVDAKKTFLMPHGKPFLTDFGRIFVYDILMNNYDRVPCPKLWKHEGNEGNLIFLKDRICAIDQSVNNIVHKQKQVEFVEHVREFVQSVTSGDIDYEKNPYLKTFETFLYANTRVTIGPKEKAQIRCGMLEALEGLKKGSVTKDLLKKLKDTTRKMKTGRDWENVYFNSLCRIDYQFMGRLLEVLTGKKKKTLEEL